MKFIADSKTWSVIRVEVLKLVEIFQSYSSYLDLKNRSVDRIQLTLRSEVEKKSNVTVLPICKKENLYYELVQADIKLDTLGYCEPISVTENLKLDRKIFFYILDNQILKNGFSNKSVHYAHHVGGPNPSMHFVWKIPPSLSETDLIPKTLRQYLRFEEIFPAMKDVSQKENLRTRSVFLLPPIF